MAALRWLTICAVVLSSSAAAQSPFPYVAPDADLWSQMGRAFDDLPISLSAHQAIQQIMSNVQREAQMREARIKAASDAAAKADPGQPK